MIFDALSGVLLIPALSACALAALPGYRLTSRLNVLATLATLATALSLFVVELQSGPYLLVDDLNKVFILLTTFVAFTTSVFSASYIGLEIEIGRLKPSYVRFYHAMYQVLMFGMNLALTANNVGLMWVAGELATLTTVLMVGIYRTHEALEAAWKYFILGSVGIALALFGTILIYMAAKPVIGEGLDAMVWTVLVTQAAKFDPALLNVAFVFLLLGYGTKVGLAPLHAWLPDAHAEGPTPISAVLSGLLLNVALYALLRFKMLLTVMHSLTKSAIFFAVGHIEQVKGTQKIAEMGGLTETNPVLGWGLVLGVVAIAGLPPLGIFMSEFLVVSSTFARQPLLAIVLVFGLLVAFGALTLRLTSVAFGAPRGSLASAEASYVPMFAHLALVLGAGIYLPAPLVVWFQHVARLLG